MPSRKCRSKKKISSMIKEAAIDDDRGRRWPWRDWPWSELPPTNLSSPIHSRALKNKRWRLNTSSPPAVTKSWLQTTRCRGPAHQRPQLRHVTAGPFKKPSPHPHNNHFLDDSTNIAEAVHEMPYHRFDLPVYWYCNLKSSDTNPKFHQPPTIPSHDIAAPKLYVNDVGLGPKTPSSGLTVNYTVYGHYTCPTSYWNKQTSIRYECRTADPFDDKKKKMEFANLIHCQGKFYATSLQGALVVTQVRETRLVITAVGAGRAVPSSGSRFFKEYLVEMEGEILLVFLIHEKSLAVVDNVEVYRLDLDQLGLIKVERLRGKTMFLNEGCVWVTSAKFVCRDDLVYFTQGLDNEWKVYDMKTCCISNVLENEWIQTMIE